MKIGIESQRIFREHKHGMDMVALELVRQLQQSDATHEFTLFAKNGPDRNCLRETPRFSIQLLKGLTYGDWEQWSLPRALKKMRPDLIHCTANTAPIRCPVPLVLTLHDIIFLKETSFKGTAYQNFGNIYRRLVVPAVIGNARQIITVSEQEKKVITESCRVDPGKVTVIHNAVSPRFSRHIGTEELEAFRRKYKLPQRFILHLGNTAPKKNTSRMIDAYAMYTSGVHDALPLVVADYPASSVRRKLTEINRIELEKQFFMPGYISPDEMPLLYRCAELFVYPSLVESFGLPVLESMSSGKPVITSAVPALQEVGGEAAVYIDPEQPESIAAAMANILADREKNQEHVRLGKERAMQFSWRNSADKLLRVYESIK